MKQYKTYITNLYKEFINKLYGENYNFEKLECFQEFKQRIDKAFGGNPNNENIDIDITIKYKTKDGKWFKRSARSIRAFVDNGFKPLPDEVERIYFEAEFVEYIDGSLDKKKDVKKKNRVAFSEKILVVDEVDDKHVRKVTHQKIDKMNKDMQAYTKEDIESFNGLITFKSTASKNTGLSV